MSSRSASLAVLLAASLGATACGTAPRPSIGMKEQSANVVYGDNAAPPPPPAPPAAEPMPGFPGFLVPPAPRIELVAPPTGGGTTSTVAPSTTTTARPVPCPEDDPLAVPKDEAMGAVPGPPKTATLPFRQTGSVTTGTTTTPAPPLSTRTVGGQTPLPGGTFRFNVGIDDGAMATVTTYQVDQRGAQDAVSIVQIRTEDDAGTDAFTPAAPITVLPLPPVQGRTFTGSGSDPLHRTALTIYGKVTGKTRVNACGTPLEAWRVQVGSDPQTGQPSRIVSGTRTTTITGSYAVATQLGGLVIAEDLVLEGTDGITPLKIVHQAVVSKAPVPA